MSEEKALVSLRGWQWSLVILLALVAGLAGGFVGGFIGGGIEVMVNDDSPRFYGSMAEDDPVLERTE